MLAHFAQQSQVNTDTIPAHPNGLHIFGFRSLPDYDYILVAIIDPVNTLIIDDHYFYCSKCQKWLRISNTIGNIRKHLRNVHQVIDNVHHPELSQIEKGVLARKMVLLNGLPFSFIENPQLQQICPLAGTRQNLAALCSRVAEDVRRNIKAHFQPGGNIIWVTIDEWTDKNSQLYLGVNAFIKTRVNNVEKVCVAHQPLSAISNDAPYISGILQEILDNYFPRSKIEGLVTDTTNLMPAIAHVMGLKWRPCYCHIINLLMHSFVQSISDLLEPLFIIQRTLGSSTVFHNYLIQQNTTVTSLPSYTQTRWYSLYKLLKNVLILQPHIQAFLASHRYDSIGVPENEFFNQLSKLITVFGTAKNVMMHLESDSFGTLSMVIDAFRLIKHSVDSLPNEQFGYVKEDFNMEYTQRWFDHFMNDEYHDELILAARLNPYQLQ